MTLDDHLTRIKADSDAVRGIMDEFVARMFVKITELQDAVGMPKADRKRGSPEVRLDGTIAYLRRLKR